jgi:hypothetical protein
MITFARADSTIPSSTRTTNVRRESRATDRRAYVTRIGL